MDICITVVFNLLKFMVFDLRLATYMSEKHFLTVWENKKSKIEDWQGQCSSEVPSLGL